MGFAAFPDPPYLTDPADDIVTPNDPRPPAAPVDAPYVVEAEQAAQVERAARRAQAKAEADQDEQDAKAKAEAKPAQPKAKPAA